MAERKSYAAPDPSGRPWAVETADRLRVARRGTVQAAENRWHVIPDQGVWVVRRDDAQRASRRLHSKAAAIDYAQRLARRVAGEVIVHRQDGRMESWRTAASEGGFREVYSYGKDASRQRRRSPASPAI